MSHLLRHPALWPQLMLDPEPFLDSADPESIERLFSEFYGFDSERRADHANDPESSAAAELLTEEWLPSSITINRCEVNQ